MPRQLPAAIANFCGRGRHLAALDRLAETAQRDGVVTTVIAGTAGVGKTALAVHWAHRAAHRYPDGQVYLNLQGYDRSESPMGTPEAIRTLLEAFAPSSLTVPDGLDAQVGLYRSLLAGRRVMIVLDNAKDADQVRRLLPGSPGCLTIVTSRDQLSGLVATEGAHPVVLDLLSHTEARELLETRLGTERVRADEPAVDEIVARCAGLPLALAIITARAASHPGFPLSALAAELRSARSGLDALNGGDVATDIRAVFSWSYQSLTPGAARLFRLLGLHIGPDFAVAAAASLLGEPVQEARRLLGELTRAHLVAEHTPGRYASHDLLRAFSAELAETLEDEATRRAGAGRLLDHYLHTAHAADRLVSPYRLPIVPGPVAEGVVVEAFGSHDASMAWFTSEVGVLVAGIGWAAEHRFDTHAWQLAWTLDNFLDRRGRWQEWAATQRCAVTAAGRLGDRRAQADAYRSLAIALVRMDRLEEAHAHHRSALELWTELGERTGQARTHRSIAALHEQQGRLEDALHHAVRSLDLFRAVEDAMAEARALNVVGWVRARLGDSHAALDFCEQSLRLLRQLGNRKAEAHTLDSLGYVHLQLGDFAASQDHYRQAVELFREAGDRYNEATALEGRGRALQAAGDVEAAHAAWQMALAILADFHNPGADAIRARLTG